ncbi:uncharacterized protein PAC_06051 [Phialocephala subalpina]|uniref:Uncharacterized protein n=1 Tax=Phialocephala subalpina TaxID=576137 RepID=A0A1L7WTT0_9HELO|nr:uncharacterized protein PAC_06051 [Phialocephala subalpina]
MKLIATLIGLLGLLTSPLILAASLPDSLSLRTSIDGMEISKMMFTGELGGYQVQLNGSIQEIHAQMKELYPDFNPEAIVANKTLETRAEENKSDCNCWPVLGQPEWKRCSTESIRTGIRYLIGLNVICNVGPQSCVRISCSYNAGIYLCNNRDYLIEPSCTYIASYAQDIVDKCNWHVPGGNTWMWRVSGQAWDTDGYNVCVHDDNC